MGASVQGVDPSGGSDGIAADASTGVGSSGSSPGAGSAAGAGSGDDVLPYTGLAAGLLAGLGAALTAGGGALRRVTRQRD